MRFEVEGVLMVACHHPRRGHSITLPISNGQDIGGFGPFPALIRDTFAAFFGKRMATIQLQLAQVEVVLNGLQTRLPDPFQASICTPVLEVVVDRLPTDLLFSGW